MTKPTRLFSLIPPAFFGLVLFLLLGGCATSTSQEWRLQSLEENFLNFREEQRAQKAESEQTVNALRSEIDRLEKELAGMKGGGMSAKAPVEVVMMPAAEPEVEAGMKPGMKTEDAPVKSGPTSPEDRPWAKVPGHPQMAGHQGGVKMEAASGPEVMYADGMNLTRAGKNAEGRAALDKFLKKYSDHKLAPNATYWLGETYYGEKNYPQAILTFKDVTRRWPKHPKAQAALLKIGMSYKMVGDTDNAVFYLRTLVDEHPSSQPAKIAKQVLADLPE